MSHPGCGSDVWRCRLTRHWRTLDRLRRSIVSQGAEPKAHRDQISNVHSRKTPNWFVLVKHFRFARSLANDHEFRPSRCLAMGLSLRDQSDSVLRAFFLMACRRRIRRIQSRKQDRLEQRHSRANDQRD
jgi:hypothetical protein